MIYTAGIDVGSTYTKALIMSEDDRIVGRGLINTGFKLAEATQRSLNLALEQAGMKQREAKEWTDF